MSSDNSSGKEDKGQGFLFSGFTNYSEDSRAQEPEDVAVAVDNNWQLSLFGEIGFDFEPDDGVEYVDDTPPSDAVVSSSSSANAETRKTGDRRGADVSTRKMPYQTGEVSDILGSLSSDSEIARARQPVSSSRPEASPAVTAKTEIMTDADETGKTMEWNGDPFSDISSAFSETDMAEALGADNSSGDDATYVFSRDELTKNIERDSSHGERVFDSYDDFDTGEFPEEISDPDENRLDDNDSELALPPDLGFGVGDILPPELVEKDGTVFGHNLDSDDDLDDILAAITPAEPAAGGQGASADSSRPPSASLPSWDFDDASPLAAAESFRLPEGLDGDFENRPAPSFEKNADYSAGSESDEPAAATARKKANVDFSASFAELDWAADGADLPSEPHGSTSTETRRVADLLEDAAEDLLMPDLGTPSQPAIPDVGGVDWGNGGRLPDLAAGGALEGQVESSRLAEDELPESLLAESAFADDADLPPDPGLKAGKLPPMPDSGGGSAFDGSPLLDDGGLDDLFVTPQHDAETVATKPAPDQDSDSEVTAPGWPVESEAGAAEALPEAAPLPPPGSGENAPKRSRPAAMDTVALLEAGLSEGTNVSLSELVDDTPMPDFSLNPAALEEDAAPAPEAAASPSGGRHDSELLSDIPMEALGNLPDDEDSKLLSGLLDQIPDEYALSSAESYSMEPTPEPENVIPLSERLRELAVKGGEAAAFCYEKADSVLNFKDNWQIYCDVAAAFIIVISAAVILASVMWY